LENNAKFGEGIVQGVVKATQTGILWSQVQVLVGPPEKQTLISNDEGFVFLLGVNLVNVILEKEYWIRIISLIDRDQLNPEFVVG
jgi:hypothetical protein